MQVTFDQLPQAVSLLIGKVDAIAQLLTTQQPQSAEPTNQWLSLTELCDYLPDHPAKQTVYQWLSAGTIPSHKKGKKVYFQKSEIDQWLAGGKRLNRNEAAAEANNFLANA